MSVPKGAEQLLAVIRSDQLTGPQVEALLQDHPLFARWYRAMLMGAT